MQFYNRFFCSSSSFVISSILQKRKTRGGGGEIIMRVIVMRIQIFSNVFHRIANFGNFHSLQSFFFLKKLKKSRAEQIYIDKKSENFRLLLKHVFHYPRVRVHFIIKYVLEMNTNPENVKNLDLVFQHFFYKGNSEHTYSRFFSKVGVSQHSVFFHSYLAICNN